MAFDLEGKYIEESVLFEKAVTEPLPCLLLKQGLPTHVLYGMEQQHIIVEVEHEGEMYKACVLGYHRVVLEDVPSYEESDAKLASLEPKTEKEDK